MQIWDTGPAEWVRRSNPVALGLLLSGLAGQLSFSLWFCDSKKSLKKNKDLLILGHPTYAGPPSTPHHQPNMWAAWVTVYNCHLCEKVFFPKSAAYLRSHIFAIKRPTDKVKYYLETPFLSRFFIFYDFLNLNQDFRANLQCKSCVQLPILWKTRFSQTLRCHICNGTFDRQNKIFLRNAIPFSFFHIFFTFWI